MMILLIYFSQIKAKRDFLEENSDILDEILSFYQSGSAQLQNYNDATEIYRWYEQNRLLEDLASVDEIMEEIAKIISDDHPKFGKMVILGSLVLKVKGKLKITLD